MSWLGDQTICIPGLHVSGKRHGWSHTRPLVWTDAGVIGPNSLLSHWLGDDATGETLDPEGGGQEGKLSPDGRGAGWIYKPGGLPSIIQGLPHPLCPSDSIYIPLYNSLQQLKTLTPWPTRPPTRLPTFRPRPRRPLVAGYVIPDLWIYVHLAN